MATIKDQQTLHANHAVVVMAGERIARLQTLTAQRDSGADYVYETGSADPVEVNHNRRSYRITVGKLIFRQGGPKAQFAKFNLGDLDPFDIEFQDRDNGTYWVARGCEVVGDAFNESTNQRIAENLQIMALSIDPKV